MGRTFKRWWMVQKGWWPDSGMEVGEKFIVCVDFSKDGMGFLK